MVAIGGKNVTCRKGGKNPLPVPRAGIRALELVTGAGKHATCRKSGKTRSRYQERENRELVADERKAYNLLQGVQKNRNWCQE